MIKLPEPYMTLQGKKRGKLSGEAMPFYTEAQLKQAVRDFGNHLAAHLCAQETYSGEAIAAIRALIKEIPE